MQPSPENAWQKIRIAGLIRLLELPAPRRWVWESAVCEGRVVWLLRCPRGVAWEFRLRHGAWVRRHPAPAS